VCTSQHHPTIAEKEHLTLLPRSHGTVRFCLRGSVASQPSSPVAPNLNLDRVVNSHAPSTSYHNHTNSHLPVQSQPLNGHGFTSAGSTPRRKRHANSVPTTAHEHVVQLKNTSAFHPSRQRRRKQTAFLRVSLHPSVPDRMQKWILGCVVSQSQKTIYQNSKSGDISMSHPPEAVILRCHRVKRPPPQAALRRKQALTVVHARCNDLS
jgi:hypothetical protein